MSSPKNSFKDWEFIEWLKGNWPTIKELIKVGAPLIIGWVSTHHPGWTVFITLLGKFILDCGHYYLTEQR